MLGLRFGGICICICPGMQTQSQARLDVRLMSIHHKAKLLHTKEEQFEAFIATPWGSPESLFVTSVGCVTAGQRRARRLVIAANAHTKI